MACLNFQERYFRPFFLMAGFIRFRSTWFSEHLKVDALSSLSNGAIFFSKYFYLKITQRNMYIHSHFHDKREFHHFLTPSLFKNFSLLTKLDDFDFFKVTHFQHYRYTNADLKICQCAHVKRRCWRFHIKTPFTFWNMCM